MKAIPLTRGLEAIVDDDDFERFSSMRWYASKAPTGKYYATRAEKNELGKYSSTLMHRRINNTPPGLLTDHINGDTLDNRKSNLRDATYRQNAQNSAPNKTGASLLKGATWHAREGNWGAKIVIEGQARYLGRYKTAREAAEVYEAAARAAFGDFYRPNLETEK